MMLLLVHGSHQMRILMECCSMGWDGMVCLILWYEWDMGLGGDPIEFGWDGIKLRMGLN